MLNAILSGHMIYTGELSLKTKTDGEIIDITAKVQKTREPIRNYRRCRDGICRTFHLRDTYGRIEPGLIEDLGKLWERIAPKTSLMPTPMGTWGDGNGLATCGLHCWGLPLTVPFTDKKLALGHGSKSSWWISITVPRTGGVVQVMGE